MLKRYRWLVSLVVVALAATAWFTYDLSGAKSIQETSEAQNSEATAVLPSNLSSASSLPVEPTVPDDDGERALDGTRAGNWWQPGQKHRYDEHPDAFIRQPLDYSPDAPRLLGSEIGVSLFDLERISDMIHRGTESNSAISRTTGRALQTTEQQKARQLLQQFFDEAIPVVDAILATEMTQQEGEAFFKPRRQQLNLQLREALGMTEAEFLAVWPHIAVP